MTERRAHMRAEQRRSDVTRAEAYRTIRWFSDVNTFLEQCVGTVMAGAFAAARRHRRGDALISLAKELAQGKREPDEGVIADARTIRGDNGPDIGVEHLKAAVAKRSERERARVVYDLLARDADVLPKPDTRRGLRKGKLGDALKLSLDPRAPFRRAGIVLARRKRD